MRKLITSLLLYTLSILLLAACGGKKIDTINIAYIGPLSKTAIDMGVPAKNAIALSIKNYNASRKPNQPKINFYYGDDQWEGKNALRIYDSLNSLNDLDIVFISNTEGTIALQEKVKQNGDILINALNSDSLLSSMNENTFKIAKRTEEANQIIGIRILELGLKKTAVLYYPNDFMTRAAHSVNDIIKHTNAKCALIQTVKGDTSFTALLDSLQQENYDAYVFFGYSNFGYAMKQGRELGITAPYFGSTTLLDTNYYINAGESIIGTECTYFNSADGNYPLAKDFLSKFVKEYNRKPGSIWPAMQAYDASEIVISIARDMNDDKKVENLEQHFKQKLMELEFYQGVCGNISMDEHGATKGIYFSLYRYTSKNKLTKVKR